VRIPPPYERSACFKEGFSKSFKRRIQSLEFDSRQVSAELPVDLCLMLIAFNLPSIDLLLQDFIIWDPAIQTLGTKVISWKDITYVWHFQSGYH
jgi:hypothetical protein